MLAFIRFFEESLFREAWHPASPHNHPGGTSYNKVPTAAPGIRSAKNNSANRLPVLDPNRPEGGGGFVGTER